VTHKWTCAVCGKEADYNYEGRKLCLIHWEESFKHTEDNNA